MKSKSPADVDRSDRSVGPPAKAVRAIARGTLDAEFYVALGIELTKARRRARLTQAQLAELVQVSLSAVSRYENGKSRLNVIVLIAVCQALGIRASALLVKLKVEKYLR